MARLNQILAVDSGTRSAAEKTINTLYHNAQKAPLFLGQTRNYEPAAEADEKLPSESALPQIKADDLLTELADAMVKLVDITATKDTTNCLAKADVVVDGATLLADMPVTVLLFLEKRLGDAKTLIAAIPTLDPTAEWHYDDTKGCFATAPVQTVRTKKVRRAHVLYDATDKHPAQVQPYDEDVPAGTWTTIRYSGGLASDRKKALLARLEALLTAVKYARETANMVAAVDCKIGERIFDYLLAPH